MRMIVKENLPHYGLQEGDQVLRINGVHATSMEGCQAMLKGSVSIQLEFRRPDHRATPIKRLSELPIVNIDAKYFPNNVVIPGGFLSFLRAPWLTLCCSSDVRHDSDASTIST